MNPSNTPNVQHAIPFFAVIDMPRSIAFYVDGLGFEITQRWDDGGQLRWCKLQLGGAALMLQGFGEKPADKRGAGVSIYFICTDALALYREFTARGIAARRPFVGNGMWVVSLTDPDGYEMHFESLTDAEEETVYEE